MEKKCQKIYLAEFCFFAFFFIGFFFLALNRVSAAGLEVQYPSLAGQTLSPETKLPDYVLYLFNAGMFLGFFSVFISLIIAGVMYLLSPAKPDLLTSAKDRVSGAISGLLILALTYLIITTINPQLSILTLTSAPSNPQPPPAEARQPGVYFYKSGCPNNSVLAKTSSITEFDTSLKNQITSADIVRAPGNIYISILYQNPNFWGQCKYISGNSPCATVGNFATSASIYKYNPDSNGGGVYFYRKSYFNTQGGYLFISDDEIKNANVKAFNLNKLYFTGTTSSNKCNVPEEEQNCIKYDSNGLCAKDGRTCPSLAGENISSVKITSGDYLVLFVYRGPKDDDKGPWTSCQEFPTTADVNKTGPQQIKWQNIRNSSGLVINSAGVATNSGAVVPNYVAIIPIQK